MAELVRTTNDSYTRLGETLNRIPNGFSMKKDGLYLKLLKWIFEPEEAEIASRMKLIGESLKKMSKRLKIPLDKLRPKIETMHKKGQIRIIHTKRKIKYGLLPFVVGIYEEQLHRMNAEFAQIFEDYIDDNKGDVIFSEGPAIQRVVPVNRVIKTDLKIHPYNEVGNIISKAKSWGIRECICRKQQELLDNRCEYPMSVCLSFSSRENAYDESDKTIPVSKERAYEILLEAEEAGLVHTSMNVINGHTYICNCCTCCCGVLKGLVKYEQPNAFVISEYVLQVDELNCNGCGKCVKRCQFDAIEVIDKKCVVNERCVGCGVCALACNKEAIHLVPRKAKEVPKPPKNFLIWLLKRAFRRRVNPLKIL